MANPRTAAMNKKKKSLTAGLNKGIAKTKKSVADQVDSSKYSKGKAVPRIAKMVTGGKKAGTAKKKQKTAAERGSRPVQERDTGPGGMTATGSKTRRSKRVLSKPKTTSRERASRPRASENTNTLRVQKAKKKKK